MQSLQAFLLVLGMTALGTVSGYFALILLIASIQAPGGEPWQAGFGQYLGGLFCGAPLGTLVGLVAGIGWARAGYPSRRWNGLIWLGLLSGLLAGPALSSRWGIHQGLGWWGTALVTIACGTVGGLIAELVLATWRRVSLARRTNA